MGEPNKQQIGDGQDDYGQAIEQIAKAAKQTAKQTVEKSAEAAANAAAASVQASVEGGTAAAEIAAGTAAGGPWGAVLSAAWAMRHTLFKILICLCLSLAFLICLIVSLPAIVSNPVFGLDGTPIEGATLMSVYTEMIDAVSDVVEEAYDWSLAHSEKMIRQSGCDYDLSMEALINYAQRSAGYDTCYILAAYSASMKQQKTDKKDMLSKLRNMESKMFPVTSKKKEKEILVPVSYRTYKAVSVTVVEEKVQTGTIDGIPQYRYETGSRTYYIPNEERTSSTEITVNSYSEVEVSVPVYSAGRITGEKTVSYYKATGQETLEPGTEKVKYLECTIHPFDNTVIAKAFRIDLDAVYDQYQISYGEAIQSMANALKRTLYGAVTGGQSVPLTDAELIAFVDRQGCTGVRKQILTTALSLVGKVPYFWGGKSAPGWNEEWNTPKLVTAAGSSTTGTIRPYGLDCSGFTEWVYLTSVGIGLDYQWQTSYAVSAEELQPGDLGFLGGEDDWTHVLMFAGYGESGQRMWVHSSGGEGVILNTPSYEASLNLRRPKDVDFSAMVG